MKKEGITKVELPKSMKKVDKSQSPDSSFADTAYMIVIGTFPSKSCRAKNDELNGKIPSKSSLGMIKNLSEQYKTLLHFNGVNRDEIDGYEQSFWDDRGNLCRPRRDGSTVSFLFLRHFYTLFFIFTYQSSFILIPRVKLVGVADPTSSLPNDSVFVSGLTKARNECGNTVLATRYPCTEPEDGKILRVITSKPQGMSKKNWDFLTSIPYGLFVFGHSSTSTPLPVQVADGDLDGDMYHVLWDKELLRQITFHNQNEDVTEVQDSEIHYNSRTAMNLMRDNPDEYDDSTLRGEVEDSNLGVVVDVIGHHRNKIKVKWESVDGEGQFSQTWESLTTGRIQYPEKTAEYGRKNKLEDETGWKWIKDYLRSAELKCVVSHRGDGDEMIFSARYDDGEEEDQTLEEMKEESPEILYKYALEKNLLEEWRNDFVLSAKKNWFLKAQNHSAELKHLYYRNKLIRALYKAWNKSVHDNDMDAIKAFSKAFKQALDYRKHQNDISLPVNLINKIPLNLQHCVTN